MKSHSSVITAAGIVAEIGRLPSVSARFRVKRVETDGCLAVSIEELPGKRLRLRPATATDRRRGNNRRKLRAHVTALAKQALELVCSGSVRTASLVWGLCGESTGKESLRPLRQYLAPKCHHR